VTTNAASATVDKSTVPQVRTPPTHRRFSPLLCNWHYSTSKWREFVHWTCWMSSR
jgi:hypothetical protein